MNQLVTRLGRELHRTHGGSALIKAALIFLIIKLLLVCYGLFAMNGPRLGDDAYVYLWYVFADPFHTDVFSSPAVQSLKEFAALANFEELHGEDRFYFFRVLIRIIGFSENFLHSFFWPTMKLESGFYALFLFQEIAVAIVLTAGIFVFFKHAPALPGIPYIIPLIGLAIYPGQGIHFLVPTTLALAFGFMCWGLVMAERPRPFFLFFAGMLAVLSHSIGIAYAAIAGFYVVFVWFYGVLGRDQKLISHARALKELSALFLVFLSWLMIKFTIQGEGAILSNIVQIGPEYVLSNLAGVLPYMEKVLERDPFGLILFCLGGYLLIRYRNTHIKWWVLLLCVCLVGILSTLYGLENYPGAVLVRFIAPVAILCFGFLYIRNGEATDDKAYAKAGIGYCIFLFAMSVTTYLYSAKNVKDRWPQIDRQSLEHAVAMLPDDSDIYYFDEDFTIMAALIAGAHEHRAISDAMVTGLPSLGKRWLDENFPAVVALNYPRDLVAPAGYAWNPFKKRYHGVPVSSDTRVEIQSDFQPRDYVSLRYSGRSLELSNSQTSCEPVSKSEEDNGSAWYQFDLSTCMTSNASVNLNVAGDGELLGLAVGKVVPRVNWPWTKEVRLLVREGAKLEHEIDFGCKAIVGQEHKVLEKSDCTLNWQPLDDRSGIVFIATGAEN